MKKQKNKDTAPTYTVDYSQFNWEDRHWNPHVKGLWNALIQVEPANSERGQDIGWRIFPNGKREMFRVGSQF